MNTFQPYITCMLSNGRGVTEYFRVNEWIRNLEVLGSNPPPFRYLNLLSRFNLFDCCGQ